MTTFHIAEACNIRVWKIFPLLCFKMKIMSIWQTSKLHPRASVDVRKGTRDKTNVPKKIRSHGNILLTAGFVSKGKREGKIGKLHIAWIKLESKNRGNESEPKNSSTKSAPSFPLEVACLSILVNGMKFSSDLRQMKGISWSLSSWFLGINIISMNHASKNLLRRYNRYEINVLMKSARKIFSACGWSGDDIWVSPMFFSLRCFISKKTISRDLKGFCDSTAVRRSPSTPSSN